MPTISGKTPIAANTLVTNVLAGSQYEFAPFDGTIEIGMSSDQLDSSCAVYSGPDTLQEPGGIVPCPVSGTQTFPKYPDDYHWEDEVAKGDRIKVSLQAKTACTINWVLRMTPA